MNRLIVFFAVMVLAFVTSVSAQVDVATATLKGSITEQAGSYVPGATITAVSTGGIMWFRVDGDTMIYMRSQHPLDKQEAYDVLAKIRDGVTVK